MVVQLHDGHGGVYHGGAGAALPLEWDWIEGKLVVTAVAPALAGKLAPGDAVLRIGGRPVAQALAAKEELVSGATAGWIRWVALSELRRGTKGKSVDLEVESFDGSTRVLTVSHEAGAGVEEKRPANLSELESGIFYVDINRTTDAAFQAALPQLERASGIVFDFRGYPIGSKFLTHLAAHKMTSAQWHVPLVVWPDRREMRFEREEGWDLAPASPLLRAKRAFVIDGRAISYAESCMGIVEAYHLGAIVGERTAGTNGNVNPFTLPGGYTVTWTGMKVLKHDSSRHHGVGIEPAIPVARTRAGVAAGHDEFLERAIRALKE
jgi:C-terminal processing protease CtpA/Prc